MKNITNVIIGVVLIASAIMAFYPTENDVDFSVSYNANSAEYKAERSKLAYSAASRALVSRDVIRINSDADFTASNGVTGGTGTQSDPYIIDGWEIDAQGGLAAIYIGNTTSYVIIRNCVVYNATNTSSLRYGFGAGIALYFAQNIKIENVTSRDNSKGIYFYGQYSRFNTVSNSTLDGNIYGFYARFNPNNNTFRNNTITNSSYGIYMEIGCAYNTFENNTVSSATYYGVYFRGSYGSLWNNTVTHNTISAGTAGIYLLDESYNTTFSYNYIHDATYGVYMTSGLHHNVFKNNTLESNGDGFYIDNSASTATGAIYSNLFEGNRIYNCTNEAIFTNGYYGDVYGNRFTENTVINPGYYGIYLYDSYSNRIDNNTIKNATYYGIRFYYYGDKNTVDSNLIINSGSYAIYIVSSNYNRIYNNSFYYNHGSAATYTTSTVQAYDSGTNYWNTTSGYGNYWYEWANNNDTNDQNNDGIVDWAYIIDGGTAKDYYPLKTPNSYAPVVPEFNGVMLIVALMLITAGVYRKKRP